MRRAGFAGEFWPSPFQEALLRAAIAPEAVAVRAWADLRPGLDLDAIWDSEAHRLLPQIGNRLRAAGLDDPDLPRLTGLGRRTWYENQMRMRDAGPVVTLLDEAGVPTLMLKGMPLAFHYYESPALRPMRDIDVLVPRDRRDRALRELAAAGWSGDRRFVSRFHHAISLRRPDGRELDLHWSLGLPFELDGDPDRTDADFWDAARPLALGSVQTRMLGPTDQFLHVCVHGAWSASDATVRWVADALTVMSSAGDAIDWDRLISQVARRRLSLHVAEPLRYLAEVHDAPVPPEALAAISRMPSTSRERACHRRSTGSMEGESVGARARFALGGWSRTSARWGRVRAAREMPFFFQNAWGLDSAWSLPTTAARKTVGRLAGRTRA